MPPADQHRTYAIKKSFIPEETFSVYLSVPRIHAENLYLQTWGSSFILANLLHQFPLPSTTRVLELGAGTGLVGISAAAIWPRTHVILTDLPTIVPGLVANIRLNEEVHGRRVTCGTLDWNNPHELALSSSEILNSEHEATKPTLILAADTMYTEDHPKLLSQTIFAWLKKDREARAVVCYPMRVAYLNAMREFWEILEAEGMEVVNEGREEIEGDEWDDERLHEWSVWRWKLEQA
ncbi:glucose-inducible sam-dependent methyltransferase [Moniliophthora roreri MCA 2997]|uniref:Glucose-inducible sam-dependent methyltransferase n=2 Tax=Moniliophthora roreri TaxID=221103 RepID=V2X733_MONRO|nr:glucose-inducible sam-dependent methyltransferase [Moniliophthora roreri MCA 2997]KAI3602210.1 glucose-inducible sam-dependent methyltransferase [Moniliophthora roreri]